MKETTNCLLLEDCLISESSSQRIWTITLSRTEKINALNFEMCRELTLALKKLARDENCRAVILKGAGTHFSAGADLGWMHESSKLSEKDNLQEAHCLSDMYEALARFPKPIIALARGYVLGGAIGVIAAADIVIALEDTRFSLGEVRIGMSPAIALPYIARRMHWGAIRRFAITGSEFGTVDALNWGLIDLNVKESELEEVLQGEINAILSGSVEAQTKFKNIFSHLIINGPQISTYAIQAFAKNRVCELGQKGMKYFLTKEQPDWKLSIKEVSKLLQKGFL